MEKKQKSLEKPVKKGLSRPMFKLPTRFNYWWVFFIIIGIVGWLGFKLVLAGWDPAWCPLGQGSCNLTLTIDTYDPEGDVLNITFDGSASQYNLISCSATWTYDGGGSRLGTVSSGTCNITNIPAGSSLGSYVNLTAVYQFFSSVASVPMLVCDDANHCTTQDITGLQFDANNPTSIINSPAAGVWQSTNFAVSVTDADTGGSGLSSCFYTVESWNGLSWVTTQGLTARACNVPFTVTVGALANCRNEGTDRCRVTTRATDVAGNTSAVEDGKNRLTYSIDYSAPTPNPPTLTPSGQTQTSITWTLSTGSDSGIGLHTQPYGFRRTTIEPWTWQATPAWTGDTGLSCGTSYTRYGAIRDALGNQTTQVQTTTSTISCDSSGPTFIFNPATRSWGNANISVILTADDPSRVRYVRYCWGAGANCDPGTSGSNTSPFTCDGSSATCQATVTQTTDGSWQLCARGQDNLGNWTTPASCSGPYQKDATSPTNFSITSVLPNPNNTGSHTVTWSASSDAHSGLAGYDIYQSTNGSGGPYIYVTTVSASTLSWTSANLPAGVYNYRIVAVDRVGNSYTTPASVDVVVDKVNPNPTTCTPASGTYSPSVSVNCTVGTDQGSPTTAVTARYIELAGSTPPAADPSCDPNTPSPAWINKSYSATTSIKIRTCDAAGNGSAINSYTWTISGVSPISFTFNPTSSSGWQASATSITLGVSSANGITSARYNWDAPANSTTGTVYTNGTVINSPSGSHNLYTWAQDGVGNTNTAGPIGPYQYDDTNPTAFSITSVLPNPNNTGSHTVTWSASSDAHSGLAGYDIYQSTNGSGGPYIYVTTVSASTLSWTSANLPAGVYNYRIVAVDRVGNSYTTPASVDVVVDKVNPNPTTCTPASGTYSPSVSVNCTVGTDQGSPTTAVTARYIELAGSTPPAADPSCDPNTPSPAWINKSYSATTSIKIRTCDAAGNGSAINSYTWTISGVSPISFTFNPTSSSGWQASATSITLGVSSANGITSARYNWDAPANSTTGTVYTNGTVINSPSGSHNLYTWAQDGVGNTNTAGPIGPYQYDDTNPTAFSITSVLPNPNNTGSHTVTWSASSDAHSGLAGYDIYQSTNGSGGPYIYVTTVSASTLSWTSANLPAGVYNYRIVAVDRVGNSYTTPASVDVVVDKVNPNPTTCTPASGTYSPSVSVNCTVGTDQGSPTTAVTARYIELAGSTPPAADPSCDPNTPSPAWINKSYSATTSIKIRTCDAAGNGSAINSYTWTISGVSPISFTFNPTSSSGWQASATSITLGVSSANGITSARYNWDAPANSTTGTVYTNGTVINSPSGSHNLYTWAQDGVGNTNTAGPIGPYQYDDTNPTAFSITSVLPNPNNTGSHTVTWSASSDSQSGLLNYNVYQSLNGAAYVWQTSTTSLSWSSSNLAAGSYTYQIVASDNVGRTYTTPASAAVIVDKTAPAAASCNPGTGTYANSVAVSCTAGADSGTPTTPPTTIHYTEGSTTPADPTCSSNVWSNKSYTSTTVLKVATCDQAGNRSTVTTYIYTISGASPVTFTFNPTSSSGWQASATSITLGVSSANGITSARYNWDAPANSTTGTVYTNGTVINSPSGSHNLYTWAQDGVGNTNTAGPIGPYQYDDTNPTAFSITSVLPNPNNTGSHTVTWSASSDSQSGLLNYNVYQSLNGAAYVWQTSTTSLSWSSSNLAAGSYTYQIVASDNVGRTYTTPASAAVIVDKTAPAAASCNPGTGTYANSVAVSCTAGADSGTPTTPPTTIHYTEGSTTPADPTCSSNVWSNKSYTSTTVLKVATCDQAGNRSTVTTYIYTISGASPVTFTFNPTSSSGWQASATSITLGVSSANGITSARYNWDAPANSTTGTVYTNGTVINSPSGSHNLYTWAQDGVGNTNTAGPIGPYQYDDTNPTAFSITSVLPNPNNTGSHTVTWSASSDSQSGLLNYNVYQSLNGAAYVWQTSTTSLSWSSSNLAAGSYTYQIVASDNVGRTYTTPASAAVIVDKTAPAAASCNPGTGTYANSVAVSCTAGADSGTPTTPPTTIHYTEGSTTPADPTCSSNVWSNKSYTSTTVLKVATCDQAGNRSTVTTYIYTISGASPVTFTFNPTSSSGWQASATSITLGVSSANGITSARYNWDAPANSTTGTVYTNGTVINSPSGSHNLYTWAQDGVGNTNTAGPIGPYQYDDTNPTAFSITSVLPNPNNTGSHTVTWSASSDSQSGLLNYNVYQSLNGAAYVWQTSTTSLSWSSSNLAAGSYTYQIVASDNVGRTYTTPASAAVIVDKTAPAAASCNPGTGTYANSVAVSCTAGADSGTPTTPPTTIHYTEGSTTPADPTCSSNVWSNKSYTSTTVLKVATCDQAGNRSTVTTYIYTISGASPVTFTFNPTSSSGWQASATSITLGVSSANGITSARYNWDAPANSTTGTVYTNGTVINSPSGSHNLYTWAQDGVGNTNTAGPIGPYQYDDTNPTAFSITSVLPNPNNTGSHTVTWSASSDSQSGLLNYNVYQSLNGAAYVWQTSTTSLSWSSSNLAAGSYTYQIVASDNVGRTYTTPASAAVIVDKTAPAAASCNPGTGTYANSVAVSCTAGADSGTPTTPPTTIHYTEGSTTPADPTCSSNVWSNKSYTSTTVLKVATCDQAGNRSTVTTYIYTISGASPVTFTFNPTSSSGWQASATSITLGVSSANGITSARYNWDAPANSTTGTVYTNGTVINSPSGSHNLYTWAQDGVGNTNTAGPIGPYQYDDTNPTAFSITSVLPNPNNTGSHTVTWSASSDSQSGLLNYNVYQSLNGAAYVWQTSTTSLSWSSSNLAAGSYTYQIVASDNVGRTYTTPASAAVIVDKTAPAAASCNPGTGTYANSVAVSCTAGADSGTPTTPPTTIHYTEGSTTPADPTCSSNVWSNKSYTSTTVLKVATCDQAGNRSTVTTYIYTISGASPVTFTFNPTSSSGWQASATSITLGVSSANGITSARYNWDAPANSTTGTVYTNGTVINSPSGSHNLYTWAQDGVGNTNTAGPIGPYQYDDTNPTAFSITSVLPNPNNTGSHTVTWSASSDSQSGLLNYNVYQSLNGAAYVWQTSTTSLSWSSSNLAAGSYTYQIVASDNVGRTYTTPASAAVIVDKTAPAAASCNPGTGTYANSVAVSCTAGADSGTPTTPPTTIHYTEGSTTPADPTCSSNVWSNKSYTSTTVLKVATCDQAGNRSTVTTYIYTISGASPVTFTFNPTSSSGWQASATSITLGVSSANGITSARYNWDAPANSTTGTVYTNGTVINSPSGSHNLYTWAQDGVGNTNTAGPIGPYQYDDTNPTAFSITSVLPNPNNTGSHTVTWSASSDSQSGLLNYNVYQSLNGAAYVWQTSTTSLSWSSSNLAAGSYTYQIVASDNVGRTYTTPASAAVIVDKTAPAAASCNPGTGTYANSVAVSCTAGADSGTPTTPPTTIHYTEGSTTPADPTCSSNVWSNKSYTSTTVLKVATCDQAGNRSVVTNYTYTISNVSRSASLAINPLPSSGWGSAPTSVSLTPTCVPEGGQALINCYAQVSVNGGLFANIVGPYPATYNLTAGISYQFRAYEQDTGGFTMSTPVPNPAFQFDNVPPTQVEVSLSGSPTNSSFSISWTASSDAHSGLARYELWRAPNSGMSPGVWTKVKDISLLAARSISDTPPSSGIWWYGIHSVDNAGNWSSEANPPGSAQGTYDIVPPVASNYSPDKGVSINELKPSLSVILSDNLTGIGTSSITVTGGSGTVLNKIYPSGTTNLTVSSGDWITPLVNGVYTVTIQANDGAGNTLNDASWTFEVINLPPNQPVIQ